MPEKKQWRSLAIFRWMTAIWGGGRGRVKTCYNFLRQILIFKVISARAEAIRSTSSWSFKSQIVDTGIWYDYLFDRFASIQKLCQGIYLKVFSEKIWFVDMVQIGLESLPKKMRSFNFENSLITIKLQQIRFAFF